MVRDQSCHLCPAEARHAGHIQAQQALFPAAQAN
jgi:hypothetical protein